jgi:hypothetical protein
MHHKYLYYSYVVNSDRNEGNDEEDPDGNGKIRPARPEELEAYKTPTPIDRSVYKYFHTFN